VGLVAWAAYHVLVRLRGRRALQLVLAVAALGAAYVLAWLLGLTLLTWLLGGLVLYAPVVALVAFQPELRAAVQQLTQTRSARLVRSLDAGEVAEEIADAAERLSRSSTGAIVAVERDLPLSDYLETGTPLNAKVSGDLLATIFTPYSPLHDGAVIIRGDTIVGAGCILPLAQTRIDDRSLGTRHRAALGLTEESDALVVVVSEETGTISLAAGGRLVRDLAPAQLRDVLTGRVPRNTSEHAAVTLGD
jgi:diadenylate cyclase